MRRDDVAWTSVGRHLCIMCPQEVFKCILLKVVLFFSIMLLSFCMLN